MIVRFVLGGAGELVLEKREECVGEDEESLEVGCSATPAGWVGVSWLVANEFPGCVRAFWVKTGEFAASGS